MFSIVIPTFKRKDKLLECLNGLSSQTFTQFEVIVVNDDPDVKYFPESFDFPFSLEIINMDINSGPSVCRNLGVDKTNFDWILFLDDDDEFIDVKLECIDRYIRKNSIDVIYHKAQVYLKNESRTYTTSNFIEGDGVELFKLLLVKNVAGGAPLCCIRKDKFIEIGGFRTDLPAMEDYELAINMAKNNFKFGFVDEVLTRCIYVSESSSVSKNIDNNIIALDKIESIYDSDYAELSTVSMKEHLIWRCTTIAYKKLLLNRKDAAKDYWMAFKLSGSIKHFVVSLLSAIKPRLILKMR